MHKTIQWNTMISKCRSRYFQFAASWLLGLILGTLFAANADAHSFLLMRQAASCRVSIVFLLCCTFLPFLLTAYAVYINRFGLLAFLCGCKSCAFAFSSLLAARSFGSAGWLVQPLLLFTDVCMLPFLFLFCIRHIPDKRNKLVNDLIICIVVASLVVCADYFWISPFLCRLINS